MRLLGWHEIFAVCFPGAYNNHDPGSYDPGIYIPGAPYTFQVRSYVVDIRDLIPIIYRESKNFEPMSQLALNQGLQTPEMTR
jgi:hypothetical protein